MLFFLVFILSSCACDDSTITDVDFRLFHSNVVSISKGVTTTIDGSEPVSEHNPSTVIYPFLLSWDAERTVIAAEGCINSLNEVTSVLLTCDKDFILDGNTILAGNNFSELSSSAPFVDVLDSGSVHFIDRPFSFEKGMHTFRLIMEMDDNQTFDKSISVDIQI